MSLGLISQDVINQIRERADIAEVVSSYVTLSRTGQNLKGLCPFHAEKTPSFTVNSSKQIFHCFGCGTGGNVFTFLMKIEGSGFPETVRELGRRLGISVPAITGEPQSADVRLRKRLEQVHTVAAAWFERTLRNQTLGRDAVHYLVERGIDSRTIEAFGLGFAPAAWDGVIKALSKEGFSLSELASAGLIVGKDQIGARSQDAGRYYDRFRGRLMFPITDLRKRVIAFGGRVMGEGEPKYLNSPETPIFSKGRTLYGLDRAREAAGQLNQLIIVEGYFDAIALHQAGVTHVAATLGTALTPDHLRTIRRFAGKTVLLFDPDAAGVRASLRTLDLFVGSGMGVTVVSLPDGQDPDVFVRKQGAASFAELLAQAPSLLDFAVEHSLRSAASGSIDDRIRSVDEILRILQKTGHRIEKEECMRRVAERLGINQQRLIERYPELLPKPDRGGARRPMSLPASRSTRNPEEWDLVHLLLHGHLNAAQIGGLTPDAFSVAPCRRILELALRNLDEDGRVLLRPLLDEAIADETCGSVVTEMSMSDRHFDDISEHITGCVDTLERKRREQVLGELIVRLRTAEQEGRLDEARRLNIQVNELRVRKAGAPPLRVG